LTVAQVKLFYMLSILSVYYSKSVPALVFKNRMLDMCSSPGRMSQLLSSLGGDVYVHGAELTDVPTIQRCTSIAKWIKVCPIGEINDWKVNITSHDDDNSYKLVVSDGYYMDPVKGVNDADFFWNQLYIAMHKVAVGGTIIIKCFNSFNHLFPKVVGSDRPPTSNFRKISRSENARQDVFRFFAHWGLCKPAASSIDNDEYYVMFCGYRDVPSVLEPMDYFTVRDSFNSGHWAIKFFQWKYQRRYKRKQNTVIKVSSLTPHLSFLGHQPLNDPIYNDLPYSMVVNTIAGLPQLGDLSKDSYSYTTGTLLPYPDKMVQMIPRSIESAVALWRSNKFHYEVKIRRGDEVYSVAGPPCITTIDIKHNRLDLLATFMKWLVGRVDADNRDSTIIFKSFALEILAMHSEVNRLVSVYAHKVQIRRALGSLLCIGKVLLPSTIIYPCS